MDITIEHLRDRTVPIDGYLYEMPFTGDAYLVVDEERETKLLKESAERREKWLTASVRLETAVQEHVKGEESKVKEENPITKELVDKLAFEYRHTEHEWFLTRIKSWDVSVRGVPVPLSQEGLEALVEYANDRVGLSTLHDMVINSYIEAARQRIGNPGQVPKDRTQRS